jgi:5-methylcytosine-specific restriction protein A
MAKDFARAFYKSRQWQACRESFIASVFGLCKNHERCHRPGVIVHHKIILGPHNIDDPNVTLNHDNLELYCIECHTQEHGDGQEVTRDDVQFDEQGNLIKRQ